MSFPAVNSVKTIAVIGTGAIGASWASWFLAKGFIVRASDPSPAGKDALHSFIAAAWPALHQLGVTPHATPDFSKLSFHATPEIALEGAGFVQESAPERLELKQALLASIDAALAPDVVIASSTSGLVASALQARMARPGRLVIGHPFNPPHLIPLVEVVGGERTEPTAIEWAMLFYRTIGKHPIHIRKEVPGHLANRLQAALWREAVHLVADGVASLEDVDAAVAYGPGLRWAIMGPHLTFHLAGGRGGMQHFLDHLGPPMESWWDSLGAPELTPEVKASLVDGIANATAGRSYDELVEQRDRRLIALLRQGE